MGSFDVSCGISGLTVHCGDKVRYQFLLPNPYSQDYAERSMFIYTHAMYQPFFPPFVCEYDDYGYVTNVERTPVTEALENIFKRDIASVVTAVGQSNVYTRDLFALYSSEETNKVWSNYRSSDAEKLEALGFTSPRPNVYQYDKYILECHNPYWNVTTTDNEVLSPIIRETSINNVMEAFSKVTKTFPGIEKEDWHAVGLVQRLGGMFVLEEVFSTLKETVENENLRYVREENRYENAWKRFYEDKVMKLDPLLFHTSQDLLRDTGVTLEYYPYLTGMEDPKYFHDLFELRRLLTSTNRIYMPTFCGEQCGNDEASLALAKVSTSILEKRVEEYSY